MKLTWNLTGEMSTNQNFTSTESERTVIDKQRNRAFWRLRSVVYQQATGMNIKRRQTI